MEGGLAEDADRTINRMFRRMEYRLPRRGAAGLRALRHPKAGWFRVPAGVLLIVGGVLGFLPVLGFWMLPLGVMLLAQDIPFLKRPTARLVAWLERKWHLWRARRRSGRPPDNRA